MRLQTLQCTQVGHWVAPLQLELSPRLTVVLGDNEAGKSTLRRAVRALLFGPDKALVAPLTVAGFDMGASLALDAATHVIQRKGRNLQAALPDGLAALLSDANAGRFASLFDLTHDNLWPQDQAFLKADGALGSLMFGARTGVSPTRLQKARKNIDEVLADANTTRKGQKSIPFHQEQFREAKQRYQQLARFAENDTLSEQHRALDAAVDQLDAKLGRLEAESRRLRGLIAGATEVEQLTHDRQLQDALIADGAPATVAKVAELSARLSRVDELASELATKRDVMREAAAELDAAEAPGELHTLVEQCDALREMVASHTADLQVFDGERQRHRLKCSELLKILERLGTEGGNDPVASARELLRPEPSAALLRALLGRHVELQNLLQQKNALLVAARRTLGGIAIKDPGATDTATDVLDAAFPHLERARSAEREIAQLGKARMDAAPALARHLAALGLAADAVEPDALRLPSADAAKQAEQALAAAQQRLDAAQAQLKRHNEEANRLQQQLAERRVQIGSVASAEDVAQARALRDQRLQALCAALAATDATAPAPPALAAQAGELRALVRQSDLLVDRRMEAGEALGELRAGEQRAVQLSAQCNESHGEVEAAAIGLSQAQRAEAALWPFLPQPPRSGAMWFARYEAWGNAYEAQLQRDRDLTQWRDALAVARGDALAILNGALPQLEALGSAQALHDEVARELQTRTERAIRIEALRKQQQTAQAAVAAAEAEVSATSEALATWQAQWDASTGELPGDWERQPVAIESWLALQDELRRTLDEIDTLAATMAARSDAITGKRQRIDTLLQAARTLAPGFRLPEDLEPAAAFAQVDAACKASAKCYAYRAALARDHAQAERELALAASNHETAHAALLKDWADAGIRDACTREALDSIGKRAARLEQLGKQAAQAEASLRGRWGEDVPAAIAELTSCGVAVLEARLADGETERDQTRVERDAAANARRDAERALQAMQQGHDATSVMQDLADAREALFDKVEERLRLQVAKLILDRAHREASDGGQGIEDIASGYFRALTGGAYSGLRISDEDSGATTLVAVESARNEKALEDLSAGTRDQIWLALRLAGIVTAAKETAFPLLLDDSLVQFDDSRAKAALQLLHEVSEQVQIVLFTHHEHVVDLAEQVLPASDLAVVVLPEVSGAMRQRAAMKATKSVRDRPALGERDATVDADNGATGEVLRSGVGRDGGDVEAAKQAILAVLERAVAPLGKTALLEAVSNDGLQIESVWPQAINSLLEGRHIAKEGEKRGARYRRA